MNPFFIISLPRSRTAWLANFLTNGDAFCHHEAMRTVSNLDELTAKLETGGPGIKQTGDADPSLLPVLPQLIARFPEARFVFVRRPWEAAAESSARAFPGLEKDPANTRRRFESLGDQLADGIMAVDNAGLAYMVADFDKLGEAACAGIHEFCLGRPMDAARFKLLEGLRVTVIAEKAASTFAPWVRVRLTKQSYPDTAAGTAMSREIQALCGDNVQAFDWLNDLWKLALTWDHLVDGDPLNLLMTEDVFEAMVLKWPYNVFWQKHAVLMAPTLANGLAAWRDGGRSRHYDIYVDSALAVAFCLGGQPRVRQYSPRLRELACSLQVENDRKDK